MPLSKYSNLRIIAGQWRGRKIEFILESALRPTADRVRETVFNWLQHDIRSARVLDAYSGSGILAFEALSRGAESAMVIEKNVKSYQQIKKQAERLECLQQISFYKGLFEDWVKKYQGDPFDVVFLDPPFNLELTQEFFQSLFDSDVVKPGTLLYLEQAQELDVQSWVAGFRLHRSQKAGSVIYQLYQVEAL